MCSLVEVPDWSVESPEEERERLEELEREICELAANIAAATCRWLLLVAEFDARRGWAEWGVKSCAHWLSWRCSIGLGTAREQVRVARRLCELPLAREAFARGELSFCKVRAITRVAMPETEASLVEIALHATGAQLEKLVRGYSGALAATLETAERAYAKRCLTWEWDDDGSLLLRGRLPAEEGALLLNALEAFERQLAGTLGTASEVDEDRADEVERLNPEALRADALSQSRVLRRRARHRTRAAIRSRWSCTWIWSHSPAIGSKRPGRSPMGRRSRRKRCGGWGAMPPLSGSWSAMASRCRSRGESGRSRLRCAERCADATTAVSSRDAHTSDSCTRITSGTGLMVARQRLRTWCSCARTIIASCTRVVFALSERGRDPFGSGGRMAGSCHGWLPVNRLPDHRSSSRTAGWGS